MASNLLQEALRRIDAENGKDPRGYELPYSHWVTEWVLRLDPDASEETQIAARGQHIRRWEIPREKYPEDRKGYLQWRETLKGFHAEQVGKIMRESGYPAESVEKTARIILKKNIRDLESQTVEDALCLVFLEKQFTDLRAKEPDEKMVEILRKTWRKMGEKGRAAALKLPLPDPEKELVRQALA